MSLDKKDFPRRTLLKAAGGGVAAAVATPFLGGPTMADPYKTATFHQLLLLSNEWCTIINDAAHRAADVLGLSYKATTFNLNDSIALTQAQAAAAAGERLFLTNSADGSSLRPISQMLGTVGGYLVNVGSNLPWSSPIEDGPAFTQGFIARENIGFYNSVKCMLNQAVKKFGPNLKILHITAAKGAFVDNLRSNAVHHAVSEFPGAKIVGSLPGNWNAEDGQKATEDLISRYGIPNCIVAQNDGELTGVLAALRGLGIRAGDQVLTCGIDGSTDILRAIKSGKVEATCFQSPAYHGIQATARLFDALNGYKPSAPERFVGFTGVLVTKANVDGVLKRYVDNKNLPFDPKLLSHVISGDKWDPQAPLVPIKYEDYYASAGIAKPAGWQPPAAYAQSIQDGEFDKVTQRYQAAYKLSLEDFDYPGFKG
ncbi:sugar ABC transporter substrate-binding protein [Acidisoma cellulosilytica]|uniref:Sugar ABC transporter substrate-binding protein n=1 Tax=Acidisoma cellulosilyticum TaxID=2802395 RepID=A0A964E5T7_9PROT|nr:sugar ABC transporter substrate-binding protein [Acidisoma cellulosilyticum]MCB8882782.1 sugar ABC transporter substrate-binding protein [Acidisoma cellulosilyticum]